MFHGLDVQFLFDNQLALDKTGRGKAVHRARSAHSGELNHVRSFPLVVIFLNVPECKRASICLGSPLQI